MVASPGSVLSLQRLFGNAAASSLIATQRQPTEPGGASATSFESVYRRFRQLQDRDEAAATRLVPQVLALMRSEDALAHAFDVAQWLLANDHSRLARRALRELENALWITFITRGGPGVRTSLRGGLGPTGPLELTERAELEVRAGHHDRARMLFGTAWVFIQMQLIQRSDRRFARLGELQDVPEGMVRAFTIFRMMNYRETADAMALARRVVDAYQQPLRQATSSGDASATRRWQERNDSLRSHLRANVVAGSVITMEASAGEQAGQEGYTLHGARGREEFVTPLPGSPRPDELGRHPAYTVSTRELLGTIAGQSDFLTEVISHAPVRAAFPSGRIDLSDETARVTLWRALHRSFSRTPRAGSPDALSSLLRVMERYLGAFTAHTGYNIDDFGRSYVGRRLPEDLTGRVLRDCGVYAVQVAAELQRAMRAVGRDVDFQLFLTTDHAMLAIIDSSAGQHYIVSNDEITGPARGTTARSVAAAYGRLMGRSEAAAIGAQSQVFSGSTHSRSFERTLWRHYQALAQLGLVVPSASTREEIYRGYYQAARRYAEQAQVLQARLDQMTTRARSASDSHCRRNLTEQLPAALTIGRQLEAILTAFRAPGVVGVMRRMGIDVAGVVFVTAHTRGHPLVRLAKAVELARHLGVPPDADGTAIIAFVQAWPEPEFAAALQRYRGAGYPSSF